MSHACLLFVFLASRLLPVLSFLTNKFRLFVRVAERMTRTFLAISDRMAVVVRDLLPRRESSRDVMSPWLVGGDISEATSSSSSVDPWRIHTRQQTAEIAYYIRKVISIFANPNFLAYMNY